MALAHFLLIAFRTRHVDFFRLSLSFRLLQTDALAAGIKLRQSVVVPQDAVALARDEHGDGNLGVHLGETTGETAYVAVAILELSESVEELIVGRVERERRLTILELMVGSCEHGQPLGIADFNHLLLSIDGDRDILTLLERFLLDIDPFRKLALDVTLGVLDADGIPRERHHGEAPLREGRLCRSVQAESHQQNDSVYLLHITSAFRTWHSSR